MGYPLDWLDPLGLPWGYYASSGYALMGYPLDPLDPTGMVYDYLIVDCSWGHTACPGYAWGGYPRDLLDPTGLTRVSYHNFGTGSLLGDFHS